MTLLAHFVLLGIGLVVAQDGPTFSPTIESTPPECWSNLTDLFFDLAGQPAFANNTYKVCPGTYDIGYAYGLGDCCKDGQLPLVARRNTKFQCGDDGSSANGCFLRGGTSHILINNAIFGEAITSSILQGFTFQSPQDATTFAGAPGDVTFVDCILENQQNEGPVLMIHATNDRRLSSRVDKGLAEQYDDPLSKVLYLMSDDFVADVLEDMRDRRQRRLGVEEERDLQLGDPMIITFDKCIFRNNRQGTLEEEYPTYGIITVDGPANFLVIDDCLFINNTYTAVTGHAITSKGGDTVIRNTCFFENNFLTFGTVELFDGAAYQLINNTGTVDEGIQCEFVAWSDSFPSSPSDVSCIDYDIDYCAASIYEAPPTTEPVPAPLSPEITTPTVLSSPAASRPAAAEVAPTMTPPSEGATVPTSAGVASRALSLPLLMILLVCVCL